MRKSALFAAALATLVLIPTARAGETQHGYVGPKKCRLCHDKEEDGAQFTKWKSGPHAKAFAALSSPKALEFAKTKKIEDPAKAPECLKCHVTGYGKPATVLGKNWKQEDGVTCESCHGFGADYYDEAVMKDKKAAVAAGLVIPDEKTCKGCHNEESPGYKPFDFAKFSKEIAHSRPKK